MVIAILLGIIIGAASVIPHVLISDRMFKAAPEDAMGQMGWFLLAIGISFVILVAGIVVCKLVAPDVVLPYAIAEVLAFIVAVIVSGIKMRKRW